MNSLRGDGSGDGNPERRGVGRGRGRGPWSSNTQEVTALRRPHHAMGAQTGGPVESRNTEQSELNKSFDDIIQNSTLSVHAAEFVPKSYPVKQHPQQQQVYIPKHSVQHRLQMAREISLQAVPQGNSGSNYDGSQRFDQTDHPQQFDNLLQQQLEQSSNIQDFGRFDGGSGDYTNKHQDSNIEDDNYLIEFANMTQNLMSVIHALILNPGCFTSVVPPLINNIRPYLEFPSQFREIIQIIIQQSVSEGNFRYSGARLCASVDSSLTSSEQSCFRWILYSLCKNEMENQSTNWQQKDMYSEEEQKKCHGLILFFAELVTQMEHTSSLGLGDLLIQLIIAVLRKPAPNSVKNICQALKLAGHTLEKSENRKEMENMMRALTELVTEGRVDSHVGRMVHNIHELRNGNWGQSSVNSTIVEPTEVIDPDQALNEAVLYGPDGKVLTDEENRFLEDVADNTTNIEDHVYGTSEHEFEGEEKWVSEDEDDVDACYEEFLKLIPKQIKNQTQK